MENVNKFKYFDFERDQTERRTDVIEIETETLNQFKFIRRKFSDSGQVIYLFYIIMTQTLTTAFPFKTFHHYSKAGL